MNRLFASRKWMVCSAVILSLVLLAGCNTVEGAGEDIQNLGEAIQDGADG